MGNRKNHFEISAFSAKWTRSRKIQCAFFVFTFSFEFLALEWSSLLEIQKSGNLKKKKSVSYPIIYIGLIQARQYLKPIHNICYKSWFYIFRIFVIIIYIIVIDDTLIWWPFLPFFLSVQCPFISFVCWTRFILTLVFYCDFTSTKVIIELNGAVKNGLIFGLHFDNSILHSELKSKKSTIFL